MATLSTHILDTSLGTPAKGVNLNLSVFIDKSWQIIAQGKTNSDGRVEKLLEDGQSLEIGRYRMKFETSDYFTGQNKSVFYPYVDIVFEIHSEDEHYHIPLILSPFGYSTYRGS